MKPITLELSFVIFFVSCSSQSEIVEEDHHQLRHGRVATSNRILGGQFAKRGELPYQLSLRYNGQHICGAVLIGQHDVITAAHCVRSGKNISAYALVGGKYDLEEEQEAEEQILNLATITRHPPCGCNDALHDIAHLRVDGSGFILNNFTNRIQLPTTEDMDLLELNLTASGWGLTTAFGEPSSILKKVTLSTVSNEVCQEVYKNQLKTPNKIVDTVFCAGTPAGGEDTCQGDSGGPVVHRMKDNRAPGGIRHVLVGITSWGPKICGLKGWPGVYTRVSKYVNWIDQTRSLADEKFGSIKHLTDDVVTSIRKLNEIGDRVQSHRSTEESTRVQETGDTIINEIKELRTHIVNMGLTIVSKGTPGMSNSFDEFLQREQATSIWSLAARTKNYNYTLSLRKKGRYICTAFMIDADRRAALTTAHCVTSRDIGTSINPSDFTLVTGDYDLDIEDEFEKVFNISKIIVHPDFNRETYENDIAYMIMDDSQPIEHFRTVRIAEDSIFYSTGQIADVSGWGYTEVGGSFVRTLQKIKMQVISNDDCLSRLTKFGAEAVVTGRTLCAVPHENLNACNGFSGAPLVIDDEEKNPVAIGLLFRGLPLCILTNPGISINLSKYVPWIQKIHREQDTCKTGQVMQLLANRGRSLFQTYKESTYSNYRHILVQSPELSWNDASEACQSVCGELAIVRTEEDLTNVKQTVSDVAWAAWVGGRRYQDSQSFKWTGTNESVPAFFWEYGQPDNKGERENCTNVFSVWDGGNDYECINKIPFICQVPLSITVQDSPLTPVTQKRWIFFHALLGSSDNITTTLSTTYNKPTSSWGSQRVVSVSNFAGGSKPLRLTCATNEETVGPFFLNDRDGIVFRFDAVPKNFWCDVQWYDRWQVFPFFEQDKSNQQRLVTDFRIYGNIIDNKGGVYVGRTLWKLWV